MLNNTVLRGKTPFTETGPFKGRYSVFYDRFKTDPTENWIGFAEI